MKYTAKEVLQFTKENDVKFIRLAFSDLYGVIKNISIMPSELEKAFTYGIDFDATAISGFGHNTSMLKLKPDPETLSILPWRPSQGRVIRMYCHLFNPDGSPSDGDFRNQLIETNKLLETFDLHAKIGIECEFYLFELDEKGYATTTPHDKATYFDIAPRDRGENVRRDICLTLETMGVDPLTSHHERGPGQHEISLKFTSPLMAADQFLTFKSVVKMIAERNGLHASFMPKPLKNSYGSGMHINLSLYKNSENLFGHYESSVAKPFTENLIRLLPELSIFTNPLTNSYARIRSQLSSTSDDTPERVWLRLLTAQDDMSRFELRSSDTTLNPYIVFNLLIQAGIDGLMPPEGIKQPHFNMADLRDAMPKSLENALAIAEASSFVKQHIPNQYLSEYLQTKHTESARVEQSSDHYDQEMSNYFDTSLT